LGKCFDHVNAAPAARIFVTANYFITLKIDDATDLAVATKVLLLLNQPTVFIVTPEIDLTGVLAV
jgi:hypothetical protein